MYRPATIAATVTALTSICLLCLLGICLISFAAFGLSLESASAPHDGVSYGMAVFFICLGILLPVIPLIIGAITYLVARLDANAVETDLHDLAAQIDNRLAE